MELYTLIVILQILVGLCGIFISLALALGPTGWSLIVMIISGGKRKIIGVKTIDQIEHIQRNVVYTTKNNNKSPDMGFFIVSLNGVCFWGYDITDTKTESRTLYIVWDSSTPFDMSKKEVDNKSKDEYTMCVLEGCSNYGKNVVTSICSYKKITPNSRQCLLLNKIKDNMSRKPEKHKVVTAFFHGPPGTGKSTMIDLILHQHKNDNPTLIRVDMFSLGQTFQHLKANTMSNSKVVILDLGDLGEVLRNDFKDVPKSEIFNSIVSSKSDWNNFFDDFERVQYPDKIIYIIATSNVNVKDIDPSLTRTGRFDICYDFCLNRDLESG
jgi:hypothetical protein